MPKQNHWVKLQAVLHPLILCSSSHPDSVMQFFPCNCTIIIIPTFASVIDGLLKEVIGVGRLVEASGFELLDVVVSAGLVLGDVLLV